MGKGKMKPSARQVEHWVAETMEPDVLFLILCDELETDPNNWHRITPAGTIPEIPVTSGLVSDPRIRCRRSGRMPLFMASIRS
jgi:hypothetical protein